MWLYHRFCLSFRDVEDLLAERGITVSHETIRQWCLKFARSYARSLRRRQGRPGDTWFLDEVFVTINGERRYLWRALDQDGDGLDILVQSRRAPQDRPWRRDPPRRATSGPGGPQHENKVISDHIIRIAPRDPKCRLGYLLMTMSHPTLGRPRVKALPYGSSIPEIEVDDVQSFSIPRLEERAEADIAETRLAESADADVQRFASGA